MENKKLLCVCYFNVEKPDITICYIQDSLEEFYKLINCDLIDITQYKDMNVICDDEGLLKDDFKPSLVINDRQALVGNLIFTGGTDEEGNLTSITGEQIEELGKLEIRSNGRNYCLFGK